MQCKRKKMDEGKARWGFVCYFCDKNFPARLKLENHIATHTTETPFFCDVCSQGFRQAPHLTNHKKQHMSESQRQQLKAGFKHSCILCHKTFPDLSCLRTHIYSHTK